MSKVKPIDKCKTPADLRKHAKKARPGEVEDYHGNHGGIIVDGTRIPLGNKENAELPVGTLRAIIRVMYAHKLVISVFAALVAIEIKTGLVSAIVKALV